MRRRSTVAAVVAAGLAAATTAAFALHAPAARPAASPLAATMPVVPTSAGHLTTHTPEIFLPRGQHEQGASAAGAAGAAAVSQLRFGGGANQISAAPALYVVFYGSQWSTSDPLAAYLQNFYKGLYGTGDDWTKVAAQYCQGVPAGTITCPTSAQHVGLPSGALVKGVWFDTATPAVPVDQPVGLTSHPGDQLAAEATRAAAHFGNTAPGSNVNAHYVIALPHDFFTAGYGAYYCAYHSYVTSNYGNVAYTNLPYMTDIGASCGQNSVNSGAAGTYDGVSIVAGHEYMETITDMDPSGGWLDSGGQENGDKCAWTGLTNLTLSTGTFAVQPTWSNSASGCVVHAP